ncbi:MAG: carbohydrate kinase [Candidatus Latescibacteria bacterium]|nr:carbohydrate kinase [Candidatus Latescibacterota bacterium]
MIRMLIDKTRLQKILSAFNDVSLLVLGDFFLDKYLIIDRRLSETSLETGLEAYQVVDVRCQPGAAGTVVSNLKALGVGRVYTLGIIGNDGEGYDLKRALKQIGSITEHMIESETAFTPTYTKPILREPDGREHEIERIDIKNRFPTLPEHEEEIVRRLRGILPSVDGVIIADQVQERNCGVITDRVRAVLADLAAQHPEKVFFADSRVRIGEYRNIIIKPNRYEAARAIDPLWQGGVDWSNALDCGKILHERNQIPVYLTMSEEGILLFTDEGDEHIPGVRAEGEIDPVGAGDSATAGIVSSLCAGASPGEAAFIGNLVASITVQKIGTTGTASSEEVMKRFEEHVKRF